MNTLLRLHAAWLSRIGERRASQRSFEYRVRKVPVFGLKTLATAAVRQAPSCNLHVALPPKSRFAYVTRLLMRQVES